MKHQLLLFFFLFFGGGQAWVVNAQTTLAQETFEGVSTDYGYTASTIDPATVGFNPAIEYFERRMFTAVTGGIGYVGTTQGLNNRQGDYTWTGESVRGNAQTNVRPAGTVTLNTIANSQNYRSFVITVAFAAPRGGTFSGFAANQVRVTDRIRIQYSFNGGAWTTVAMLMGNNALGTNQGADFQQLTTLSDSTSVANGGTPTGNGVVLDQTYRDITATLPSTALGANLQVRVVLDTRNVEVAFDNIRVTGVPDITARPTLTNVESTAVSYTEGGNPVPLTSSLAVGYSDNSATTLTGGTVAIGSFVTGQDVLNLTNQNGITGSYNTSTGVLTLSGTATQAAYQTALRSITYSNSNTTTATGGARSVTFQVYNGATLSTTAARTITVTSVLNPPAPLNHTENFDTDGEGTRYFGNQFANTGSEVGFFRATTAPATYNGSRIGEGTFTGWSGSYWFGEGNDDRNNLVAPLSTLQLAPVNASGRSTIKFTIALGAAGNWLGYFNADNPGDRFELYYSVNGADPVKFGAFYGVNGAAPARQDSDLDPLTPATGTQLTPALQDFTFDLPAAAAVGNLTFLLRQRARGQSEIAFDNIRITGTMRPTVVTATPSSVSNTGATLGGSITSDGGTPVTERGVVYSTTNANPTVGGTGTTQDSNASGSTSFTKVISGLSAGTRYYVAAYATNAAGTAYGNTLTFVTAPNAPVVNLPANNATVSTTPTYSGTSQTGSTVTVYVDGTALSGAATIDASGNWTKAQPSPLGSGSHRVYATATVTVNSATSPSSATSNGNTFSVDATGPSVTSVGVPTTGTYRAGQVLSFTVNFAESTIVSGVPQLGLTIGASSRAASYSMGSGSTALVFIYSVQPGEQDTDGISLGALSLNGGSIRDGAGNNATLTLNNVGATAGVLVDALAPGVSISSSAGASGASTTTSPVPFTLTFTESVTGLNGSELSVSGGTPGDFAGSGTTYTFSVAPSGNGATISVNVGGGVAQDAAGNNNTAAASAYSITYTQSVTGAPVIIAPGNGGVTTTTTPTYAGTAPAGSVVTVYVDGANIAVTVASGGAFSLPQSTALSQGSHTVYATAQAGGSAVSANSNTNTFTVDTVRPTVVISSSAGASGGGTGTTPIPFTVTFSENVTGFVSGEVTVGNGSISSFTGSGTTYTFNVMPTTFGTATTVNVPASVAQDAAGNTNMAAASAYSLTYAPLPTLSGFGASPGSVCAGSPLTFTATVGNVTGSYAYTLTNGAGASIAASSPNTALSQNLTASGTGVQSFTLTVSDNGLTSTATTSVTVNALPVAGLTNNGPLTTNQTNVTLTATPVGQTGGPFSYVFSAGATPIGTTNQATVNASGTYSVTVTTTNGCSDVASTSVSQDNTAPVNAAPVATANPNQMATVGGAFSYTVNAFSDPEGRPLTYSASISPANGFSFDPTTRVISGMPTSTGVSSVTVVATDPGSLSASTSFTITVSPAPVVVVVTPLSLVVTASPATLLTTASTTLSAAVSGGTPSYRYVFAGPGVIAASGNTASVSGLVAGVQTFTVTATDATTPTNQVITGTISVTVSEPAPTNQAPTTTGIANQVATVSQGFSMNVASSFADSNGDALSFAASGLPTGLSLAGSTISGTPSMSGTSTATVTATDPGNLSVSTQFSITVNPAPVVVIVPSPTGPFSITGVTTVSCLTLSAGRRQLSFSPRYVGTNGQPISFSVVSELLPTTQPGPYTLNLYTDNPVITLKATQSGSPVEASFAYNWLGACTNGSTPPPPPTNQAPTTSGIANQVATVGQPHSLNVAPFFSDANGDMLSYSASGLPTGLSLVGSTISGTPSVSGVSTVTVRATDPGSLSVSASFTLTVNPASVVVVPPPTAPFSITGVTTVSCTTLSAGQRQLSFTPRYAGLSGQPVSFSVVSELLPTTAPGPYTLNLYTDNPVITLKAIQSGSAGAASFAYNWLAACTNGGTPPPVPTNQAPTTSGIANQMVTVGQGFSMNVVPSFADPNGDALSFAASGLPTGLNLVGSTISGIPAASGVSSVTVTATDPGNLSVKAIFELTVNSAAGGNPPTTAPFAITGATTVNCTVLSAGQRQLTFSPQYTGTTGQPVSFSVVNELLPTADPGPYTLKLYTDNPIITLKALQQGTAGEASFSYNWLGACNTNSRIGVAEPRSRFSLEVLGNPAHELLRIRISGAQGQTVKLRLTDGRGRELESRLVEPVGAADEQRFELGQTPAGMLLLQAISQGQTRVVKILHQ